MAKEQLPGCHISSHNGLAPRGLARHGESAWMQSLLITTGVRNLAVWWGGGVQLRWQRWWWWGPLMQVFLSSSTKALSPRCHLSCSFIHPPETGSQSLRHGNGCFSGCVLSLSCSGCSFVDKGHCRPRPDLRRRRLLGMSTVSSVRLPHGQEPRIWCPLHQWESGSSYSHAILVSETKTSLG